MKKNRKFFKSFSWAQIFLIFASLSFLLRTIFLIWERKEISFSPLLVMKVYAVGLFFDLITLAYFALPALLYFTLIPNKFFNSKKHQIINGIFYFLLLYIFIFSFVSEIVFWDEFHMRFNFIAVDYLIYTTEVISNIVESYPVFQIFGMIFVASAVIFFFTYKKIIQPKVKNFSSRLKKFAIFCTLLLLAFFTVDSSKISRISGNNYINEAAENGIYQLFSAYRNNQIDYLQLYLSMEQKEALAKVREKIAGQEPHSEFLNDEDISRLIPHPKMGPEKRYNVILIALESMSADFMAAFGNDQNITPNLDALAKEGLFFTGLKATGTRTVRGLEALVLSTPPTPGNSIVRRPHNENLFNISSPLKERGYEAKFIYGGDGYFDNMNYFFSNNGFKTVDRRNFSSNEISFSNAWGVSDEDLFRKTISEADKSFMAGKPFLNFAMTTSNHRPFTYPEGRIDIKPKTGRNGAVKYSDYAIGKLLEEARKKPWFDNTIFIFVADHCAGSAGNTEVPLWRYQIPVIFYAPKLIKPRIFEKNVSQIDITPTLFGIMNLSYKSKFFGTDVILNEKTIDEHSFISTYTDIGYFKKNKLYVLKPKKQAKFYNVTLEKFGWNGSREEPTENYDEEDLEEAISYYQTASYLFQNGELKNFQQN